MKKIVLPLLLAALFATTFPACQKKEDPNIKCFEMYIIVSDTMKYTTYYWGLWENAAAYFHAQSPRVGSYMKDVPRLEVECIPTLIEQQID